MGSKKNRDYGKRINPRNYVPPQNKGLRMDSYGGSSYSEGKEPELKESYFSGLGLFILGLFFSKDRIKRLEDKLK